jgi:pimeloyl-ACP methyl ester carboxylesterase
MNNHISGRATASVSLTLAFVALLSVTACKPTPEMVQHALADQRKTLLAQCPPPAPRVPQSDEARYPIHIDQWGGSGPEVLLIHGGVQGRAGGGPKTFDRQQALVNMGWSVERVSRPGFGESPSRGPDDMQPDARALTELIKPDTNVIAHSWGGTEALLAVARRPERVRSLILIEPAIPPTIGGPGVMDDPAVAADLKKRTIAGLSAKTPADFARTFSSQMGEMTPDMLQLGPGTSMTDQDAAALGCSVLGARMASQDDILAAIETVKKAHIPVLIVTGGWSPSFDATAEVLVRLLEGRHVIVRSPNHFVQYTNAEEFNAVASDFMRSADKRSRP